MVQFPKCRQLTRKKYPTGVYIIKVNSAALHVPPSTPAAPPGTNLTLPLLGITLTGLAGLGPLIRKEKKRIKYVIEEEAGHQKMRSAFLC